MIYTIDGTFQEENRLSNNGVKTNFDHGILSILDRLAPVVASHRSIVLAFPSLTGASTHRVSGQNQRTSESVPESRVEAASVHLFH